MKTAISKDSTSIAYDELGEGPPLILVGGALRTPARSARMGRWPRCWRSASPSSTTTAGARVTAATRGPGPSSEKIEDLDALIEAAGGSASVFGISSGAVLALEAASRGLPIEKLALYEAPLIVDDSRSPLADDYLARLQRLVASDRRGDALRLFMREGVGLFAGGRRPDAPHAGLVEAQGQRAHTLPYDAAIVSDYEKGQPLPAERWAAATMPMLAVAGGKSPDWMRNAMRSLADVLETRSTSPWKARRTS